MFSPALKYSTSSKTIDCREVQFSDAQTIDLNQLQSLFNATAFWAQNRPIEDLALALSHSYPVVSAWHNDQLIGFARATSDWVYRATIWDVVVNPAYQGAGIGRKLIHTILSNPAMTKVERIYLMTTQQQEFYKRIGFDVNPSTTMLLINQSTSTCHSEIARQIASSNPSSAAAD